MLTWLVRQTNAKDLRAEVLHARTRAKLRSVHVQPAKVWLTCRRADRVDGRVFIV